MVKIRKFTIEDSVILKNLFLKEDSLLNSGINIPKNEVTIEYINFWIQREINSYDKKTEIVNYAIINDENILIGHIGFGNIDIKKHTAFVGYWISKENRGKNLGFHSLKLFLTKYSKQYFIKRVLAEVNINNISSIKILEKNNFKLKVKIKDNYIFEREI